MVRSQSNFCKKSLSSTAIVGAWGMCSVTPYNMEGNTVNRAVSYTLKPFASIIFWNTAALLEKHTHTRQIVTVLQMANWFLIKGVGNKVLPICSHKFEISTDFYMIFLRVSICISWVKSTGEEKVFWLVQGSLCAFWFRWTHFGALPWTELIMCYL